ncbi:MAG: hypothetical protein PHS79_01445 [Patescibacteria group bacterium]|nr:hypothetical protein [Patescibacteria group bacterium]
MLPALAATPREGAILRRKSRNLAFCYLAFSLCGIANSIIWPVASSAVACAVYDLLTDGRGICERNLEQMIRVLGPFLPPQSLSIAADLYHKEMACSLTCDGLERGADTIRFVHTVLGFDTCVELGLSEWHLGRALQTIDDLLDYDSDIVRGELNCLTSVRAPEHVEFARCLLASDAARGLYMRGPALYLVVKRALGKAISLGFAPKSGTSVMG